MRRFLPSLTIVPLAGTAGVLLFSCMAAAPREVLAFEGGRIRAESLEEAASIEAMLAELQPRVLALLPDSSFEAIEVWMQDRPSLYRTPRASTADAEGLWSPAHRRIMLSRDADDVRRTLAHELVHAALGASWSALPGTLEEGLADHVSAHLSAGDPGLGAERLRAGRLSAAALAAGGIELVLEVERRADKDRSGVRRGWNAKVRLAGDEADPLAVFHLSAGLSSTKLERGPKRGYYGLAFLVIDRIVERVGYDGLHALCVRATDEGHAVVPTEWLLAAAELGDTPEDWRLAASESMSETELALLVEMYPSFLVDALVAYLGRLRPDGSPELWIDAVDVSVTLGPGARRVGLARLPGVREAVVARLVEAAEAPAPAIADSALAAR